MGRKSTVVECTTKKPDKQNNEQIIQLECIQRTILLIRGEKVILDSDLARLYGVKTSRLNEQVRRNINRFPDDFMFQLTAKEHADLKSHFAISSSTWGGRRKYPLAFTEHGAIMAASVLNTPRAVEMSVFVVRAFVKLRALLATQKELNMKVTELERKLSTHDDQIIAIIAAIKQLMAPPEPKKKRRIGFLRDED
ncbi:MAG: ORF6N domain protein [Syntrophorhabdus sp. PtaU1.Bin058]|nr:MAG: ORF6N domain protein [Syntrophorhabdus sp. PtaU1.Bin058]